MKKLVLVLIAAALLAAWLYGRHTRPGPDLTVVYYFSTLHLPQWTPLSRGYPPGSPENPAFLQLSNDRYLVMIVSVPARYLLHLSAASPPGHARSDDTARMATRAADYDRDFPRFTLTLPDGRAYPPEIVTTWPRRPSRPTAPDFADDSDWYPVPGGKPNLRYHLALAWHLPRKDVKGPFRLQMDLLPPIAVSTSKHDPYYHWGRGL